MSRAKWATMLILADGLQAGLELLLGIVTKLKRELET